MSPLSLSRCAYLFALVLALGLPAGSAKAVDYVTLSSGKPYRIQVRITAPGGVLLQTTLPAEGAFTGKAAFSARGYRRGMNESDLQISGWVELDDKGVPNYRAQCAEDRPEGKHGGRRRYYDSFWGNLKNGRHLSQPISKQACRGVLVDVALVSPEAN